MSTPINVLLVEPDLAQKDNFTALAEDANYNVKPVASSYEAIQWLKKNNDINIVVVNEDAAPLNAYLTFDYIRHELKNELPVAISYNESIKKERPEGYNYIEKPFSQKSIKVLSGLTASEESSEEKVYSLEYLETISGGNQEFLIDCLKTFISSVSQKLDELETATNEQDIKNAGAIAHNIKPSFEMLENFEARDICNKLTYESDTSNVPQLKDDLKAIFDNMHKALRQDFPELR